jgi:hypothetical protein
LGETNNQNKLGKKMVLACKLEDEHDDEDNHVKQIDEA